MEQQTSYKRTWREPPATLDTAAFKVLWKKQRLAEVRAAILRGDWPSPVPSDSDSSDDEDRCSASTSCTNSPRHSGRPRHSNEQQDRHHHEQDSEEDAQFEEALQEAADTELQAVLARLQEQHELQLQQAHAAVKEVEEEHTATTKQIADIQAQLDELKRNKHELFQELKLANQAAAREAAAAAQQAALQQQQRQWQQHQQMPPPPSLPFLQQQGHTPFHAASYGGLPFPASTPLHPQQQQPTTPRLSGQQQLQTSSSGLLSPAARPSWMASSPQQPPPPPPPRSMEGAGGGSSGGGSTPSYQQQHAATQRLGVQVPPAFQQVQPTQQHQYGLGPQRQGSWATPTGQHQQQQQQASMGRASSDAQFWASIDRPAPPRLDRLGSDRLERLSSSGVDGQNQLAAPSSLPTGREAAELNRQQQLQPPQPLSSMGSPYGPSPREQRQQDHTGSSRPVKAVPIHDLQAPDSPEEGEALPSPTGPALRDQAMAAVAAALDGPVQQHAEAPGGPGALPQPSPRIAPEATPSSSIQGGAGGIGGTAAGAYRGHAAADASEEGNGEGARGAAGLMLTGLRRSSSGGSTSGLAGLHALTSPTGMHRLPRESPRALPTTPTDPLGLGRRGQGGAGPGYRPAGYYPSGGKGGAPGSAAPGSGGTRGREEGAGLPAPWQLDRRRSSSDGWDRFGGHMQAGEGTSGGTAGPGVGREAGAGKPWGRHAGRGRAGPGAGYHSRV